MKPENGKIHLVLNFAWYDEILSGRKRVEYRAKKRIDGRPSVWVRRLWKRREKLTHVIFKRGYTSEKYEFKISKIDQGPCPYSGWEGDFFRIHFEE